jgi:ketosteroid isomerase-like protein
MSERELEIVRSVVAAWDRGDVDEMERWIAADAELRPLRAQLEGTVYRGPEGLRELWDDLNADWEDLKLPVDELREVGDKVLALGRLVARGRASGIELEVPIGQLWEVRDGRVVAMVAFSDPEDAVRAASA